VLISEVPPEDPEPTEPKTFPRPLFEPDVKSVIKLSKVVDWSPEAVRDPRSPVSPESEPEPKLPMIVERTLEDIPELVTPIDEPEPRLETRDPMRLLERPKPPRFERSELMTELETPDRLLELTPAVPKFAKSELAMDSMSEVLTPFPEIPTTELKTLFPSNDNKPELVVRSPILRDPMPAVAPEIRTGIIELISLLFVRFADDKADVTPAKIELIWESLRLTL